MVYKNLIIRLVVSLFLITIYFFALMNNYILLSLISIIYSIIAYEIMNKFKKFNYIILSYLFLSFACSLIYIYQSFDIILFNILVFVIIIFDTLSYILGSLFGKRFIFKKISPKKTLEGYVLGFFITNLILQIYFLFFNTKFLFFDFLIFVNFIIIISIFGDLFQSIFKRINNIKDSSSLLPGHGGFFDRFDSFISSIIFLFIYSYI